MAYDSRTSYNALIVGAIAVIVVLALFLMFRGPDATQQAGVDNPPPPATTTTPPPAAPAPPAAKEPAPPADTGTKQ